MRLFPLVSLFLLATVTAHAGSSVKALTKQFRRLDSNKDTSLSTDELGKLLPAKFTRNGALVETQEAMFAWFDEDASEGIDLGEWIEGKTSDGADSPDFYGNVFDELDANGDGKLKWKEFNRVIPKYVSAKTARGWFNAISSGSSTGSSMNSGFSASISNGSYSGGTLSVASGSTFFASGVNIRDNGAIIDTTGYAVTITQALVHSTIAGDNATDGGLVKNGAGTLTLYAANTYTGTTVINTGTLVLASTASLTSPQITTASGAVFDVSAVSGYTVASGVTLTNDGTVNGDFTLATGGTLNGSGTFSGAATANGALNPGNGPGFQTFASGLTLGSTSVTTMEIVGSGATVADSVNVTGGTLTFSGNLSIVDFGGYDLSAQTGTYNLFDFVTGTGNFDVVTIDGNSLTYNGGTDTWNTTAGDTTYEFNEGTGVLSVSK